MDDPDNDDQNTTVSRVKFCVARGAAVVLGLLLIISILINADTSNRLQAVCSEFLTASKSDSDLIFDTNETAAHICAGQPGEK